jgi:ribosomal protein S6--L-glutamate ligase
MGTVVYMVVTFLSDPQVAPELRRLWLDAAEAVGVEMVEVAAHHLAVEATPTSARVLLNGEPFQPDAVLLRAVVPFLGLLETAVPLWQEHGAVVLNTPAALRVSRDKLAAAVALHRAGVTTPTTLGFSHRTSLAGWYGLSGLADVVVKPAHGSKGAGVRLFPSTAVAAATLDDTAFDTTTRLVAQPRLGPYGEDLRIFVVGERCVAAIRRRAGDGGFAANASLGGSVEPYETPDDVAAVAIAAVRALGLDYGGVDILETAPPTVLEVNGLPGFAHLVAATGHNPGEDVLRLLQRRAQLQQQALGQQHPHGGRP